MINISGGSYMCTGCGVYHGEAHFCWKHHNPAGPKGLVQVVNGKVMSDCMHDNCPTCGGSGVNRNTGGSCIHGISCPCKRCSTYGGM